MKKTKNIIVLFVLCTAALLQAVDMSSMFRSLGSEMHTQTDGAGRTAAYWTSGGYDEYLAASGSDVWIDNGRYIIFESVRPRPVGGTTAGERQLMAADTQSGTLYWIRALTRESTATYGTAHIEMPSATHYDCSEATNLVAFRDITGHRLYCLNLNTGAVSEIWTLTDGTFYGPPVIAKDGTWVMVNALFKGPDAGVDFAGTTSALCKVPLNPLTGTKTSNPVSIYDRVSLAAGGNIVTFLGAAINKFTGNAIVYDVTTDNAYAIEDVTALRYIENDGSLMSGLMSVSAEQDIKDLFWAGNSRYVYYIDGEDSLSRRHSLTRMHTLSWRQQKWTPTLAAKQIRLTPAKRQGALAAAAAAVIGCFEISDDETKALYTVEGRGIYYINIPQGKTESVLSLSADNIVESLIFNGDDTKSAFAKRIGAYSKIGTVNIN